MIFRMKRKRGEVHHLLFHIFRSYIVVSFPTTKLYYIPFPTSISSLRRLKLGRMNVIRVGCEFGLWLCTHLYLYLNLIIFELNSQVNEEVEVKYFHLAFAPLPSSPQPRSCRRIIIVMKQKDRVMHTHTHIKSVLNSNAIFKKIYDRIK